MATAQFLNAATSNAFSTTLDGNVALGDTSILLTTVTGLQAPGILCIDRTSGTTATPNQREYIGYTGISTRTLTGVSRGLAGSTAQPHNSGALVEENMSIDHWNDLIASLSVEHNSAGTHKTTVVTTLTGTQTLTNKTLTSPVINTPTINNGVFTGGGALSSKMITATRVFTTATGDVAYTGVGFRPTTIILIGTIDTTNETSWGVCDSALGQYNIARVSSNGVNYSNGGNIGSFLATATGDYQLAAVKSFDADGFTLTWTKGGSPTGTGILIFLCFR